MTDDERYNLKPLPEIPFIGLEESRRLNAQYEADRIRYRIDHPHVTKETLADEDLAKRS